MSFNNSIDVPKGNFNQTNNFGEASAEPSWLVVIRLAVEAVIALAGVIGNFAVCFAISRHRILSTLPTNTYIRNAAIGDLATLLVSFPFGTVREQFTYWPLGEFTCRYIYPMGDIFFGVSIWSITAIAVERHRILSARFPQLAFRSMAKPRIVCAVIWIFSFLWISLPLLLVFEYYHQPNGKTICAPMWPHEGLPYIYGIALSLISYVIPLSLILMSYCAIKRQLRKSESFHMEIAENSFTRGFRTSQVSLVKTRTKRVSKIMTPVVAVFAITVLPLSIFRVIPYDYHYNNQKHSFILFRVSIFFYLFNSACNPFIYSLVSGRFRRSFKEIFS